MTDITSPAPILRVLGRAPDAAFVVHGEPHASEPLRQRLADELGWTAVVPIAGERVRVD